MYQISNPFFLIKKNHNEYFWRTAAREGPVFPGELSPGRPGKWNTGDDRGAGQGTGLQRREGVLNKA